MHPKKNPDTMAAHCNPHGDDPIYIARAERHIICIYNLQRLFIKLSSMGCNSVFVKRRLMAYPMFTSVTTTSVIVTRSIKGIRAHEGL